MIEYTVVASDDLIRFQLQVTILLEQHWELRGDLIVSNQKTSLGVSNYPYYHQVLTKDQRPTPSEERKR